MFIDIIAVVLLLLAIVKGISKGFVIAVFSMLSFIIGLAAALKLSASVGNLVSNNLNITGYWLPFLAFLLVFIGVVLLTRIGASVLKKTLSIAMMGWADGLAGIILYTLIYGMTYSIFLFYAAKMGLLYQDTINESVTFRWIEPFGPMAIKGLGKIIPFFSNMFAQLSRFFEGIAR